jgi:hypothetical protein
MGIAFNSLSRYNSCIGCEKGRKMFNFICGFVLGVAVVTLGVSNMAHYAEKGVSTLQEVIVKVAK